MINGKARKMPVLAWLPFLIVVFALAGRLEAAGLKVAPARFIVHDVKPGQYHNLYKETGLRLAIFNENDTTGTWRLSTHRPSERGRWETGYAEIPDPRWCGFEQNETTAGPHSAAYAHLWIRIPADPKYYNQHWIVTLGIEGQPGLGGIALAVDVRVQIETKSSGDVKVRPAGLLGLNPSTIRFDSLAPGERRTASVVLYNNDTTTHTYDTSSLFIAADTDRKTYLMHGYEAIPDGRWIARPDRLRVGPGGSAELPLVVQAPHGPGHGGKKWEEILLVRPDQGLAGFVRVQIGMSEQSNLK